MIRNKLHYYYLTMARTNLEVKVVLIDVDLVVVVDAVLISASGNRRGRTLAQVHQLPNSHLKQRGVCYMSATERGVLYV